MMESTLTLALRGKDGISQLRFAPPPVGFRELGRIFPSFCKGGLGWIFFLPVEAVAHPKVKIRVTTRVTLQNDGVEMSGNHHSCESRNLEGRLSFPLPLSNPPISSFFKGGVCREGFSSSYPISGFPLGGGNDGKHPHPYPEGKRRDFSIVMTYVAQTLVGMPRGTGKSSV